MWLDDVKREQRDKEVSLRIALFIAVLLVAAVLLVLVFPAEGGIKHEVSMKAYPSSQFWVYKPALVSVTFVVRNPWDLYCRPFFIAWGDGATSFRASACTDPPSVWSETMTHLYHRPNDYTIMLVFMDGKKVYLVREVKIRIIH